jgi:hypothetical protein
MLSLEAGRIRGGKDFSGQKRIILAVIGLHTWK